MAKTPSSFPLAASLAALFRWLALLSAFFTSLFYLAFPTRRVQGWFQENGLSLAGHYHLGLFLLVLGTAVLFALSRLYAEGFPAAKARRLLAPRKWAPHHRILLAVLAVIAFLRTAQGIFSPLSYDELNIGSAIARSDFGEMLSLIGTGVLHFTNTQHSIAMLASFFSMNLLGPSELAIRLPSLVFTAALLLLTIRLCLRHLTPIAGFLLLANLAANENLLYNLHTSRGYATLVLFSLGMLVMLLDLLRSDSAPKKANLFGFFACLMLCCFSNTNGGIFCIAFFLSLLSWASLNRRQMTANQLVVIRWLVPAFLLILPFIAMGALLEAKTQSSLGQFQRRDAEVWIGTWGGIVGAMQVWWGKALVLFCVGLALLRTREGKCWRKDWLGQFLVVAGLFLVGTLYLLHVQFYSPRYALAFLIPFLFWVGAELSALEAAPLRASLAGIFMLLIGVVPLASTQLVYEANCGNEFPFLDFIHSSMAIAPATKETCVIVQGSEPEATWARALYSNKQHSGACRQTFILSLSDHASFDRNPSAKPGAELLNDGMGRTLRRSD